MLKNRTLQIIFYTVYCTLGLVGSVASLGIFDNIQNIRWEFYIYFTNISNYLCLGVMVASLISVIKRKNDDYVKVNPVMKFIGILAILLTFFVFNIMIGPGRDQQLNWRIGSILFHILLPIMYVADWFLFYERRQVKWYYPLVSVSFPLGYMAFLLIHASILGFDSSILMPDGKTPLIYPYFFVNFETQGPKVLMWIGIFAAGFIVLGYLFYGLDNISRLINNIKRNKSKN